MTKDELLNWRMSMDYGGGLFGEMICHQLDAVEWIMNTGHVQKVSGFGNIGFWRDGRTSFDNIHAVMNFDKDLVITANALLNNTYNSYSITIFGTKATVILGLSDGRIIPYEQANNLKEEVDAITGASIKIWKKDVGRQLKEKTEESVRAYYSKYVQGFNLDTLMGYKTLADTIFSTGTYPNTSTAGKHNSIAARLANNAMIEGGMQSWKPEYGA